MNSLHLLRCVPVTPNAAADPTADVEGLDVQAKIALLTKLAFGATVSSESVSDLSRLCLEKIHCKDLPVWAISEEYCRILSHCL